MDSLFVLTSLRLRIRTRSVGYLTASCKGPRKYPTMAMFRNIAEQGSPTPRFPINLIRTYNHIFNPRDFPSYYHLALLAETPTTPSANSSATKDTERAAVVAKEADPDYAQWHKRAQLQVTGRISTDCNISNLLNKRHRGEKKAIPEEQKDTKYFERRRRNNEAAKRSRDARKLREDRIAFRASILEQENALLKTQIFSLRDEIATLRQMMFPAPTTLPLNSN